MKVLSGIIGLLFLTGALTAQVDSVYTGAPHRSTTVPTAPTGFFDNLKDNLVWGSNFQFWFGTSSYFYMSPSIGYNFYDRVQLSTGLIYNRTKFNTYYGPYVRSIFGSHNLLRILVTDGFFLQAQFDKLYQPDYFSSDPNAKRWVDYAIVGCGFRQQFSEKAQITTSFLYNLNNNPLSIYPGGFIIQFGLTGSF